MPRPDDVNVTEIRPRRDVARRGARQLVTTTPWRKSSFATGVVNQRHSPAQLPQGLASHRSGSATAYGAARRARRASNLTRARSNLLGPLCGDPRRPCDVSRRSRLYAYDVDVDPLAIASVRLERLTESVGSGVGVAEIYHERATWPRALRRTRC